jgi:hypothetical protein
MNLLVRRRVLWDRLAGALWALPTVSVVTFLAAGALLSRVSIRDDSPLRALAFQGTAEDARALLIVVSTTMITVTGLVFALTIVAGALPQKALTRQPAGDAFCSVWLATWPRWKHQIHSRTTTTLTRTAMTSVPSAHRARRSR